MACKRGFGARADRYVIPVYFTQAEEARVRAAAAREDLSAAAYLRRCLNGALLDAGDAPVREETRHRVQPATIARIRALAATGLPTRLIAARLGCSLQVAYWWGKRRLPRAGGVTQ